MGWIKWNGQELPKGRYIVSCMGGFVGEMNYTWNEYAKTRRGSAPRWEWDGRIAPWEVTHYMLMPSPPQD